MTTVARPDSERKRVELSHGTSWFVSTAESASTQPKLPETQVDSLVAQLWACLHSEWRFAAYQRAAEDHAHALYSFIVPAFGGMAWIDKRNEDVSNATPIRTALRRALLTDELSGYGALETHRREVRGIISAIRQLTLAAASAEIHRLAEDAVRGLAARENEDIDAWARQLAQDVADATD